jgi:L,D-peptidoglycan transpeptidase YkuD (ErfK/YbiS/YcfS/YnhG family)
MQRSWHAPASRLIRVGRSPLGRHRGIIIAEGRPPMPCALGAAGITRRKREGDHATPAGLLPLREIRWRADRLEPPRSLLPLSPIAETDGWCDDPASPDYNRPVALPHPAGAERLWRVDRLYDILVVLGYNDSPPRPGLGSAIFLHLERPDHGPTEGCIAVSLADMRRLLAWLRPGDRLLVE